MVRSINSFAGELRKFLGTDAALPRLSTSDVSHDIGDVAFCPLFTNCVFKTCISFDFAVSRIVVGLWIDDAMGTSSMVCT